MPRVLVVEDEPAIADAIVYALKTEGFEPVWCRTCGEARAALARGGAALAVLDVGLPDGSGFELCKEIRRAGPLPVIFLTARSGEVDRVVGLEIGGDDYMVKPFSPRELTARVRAVLRRAASAAAAPGGAPGDAPAAPPRAVGAFVLDEDRCQVTYHGRALDLARYEYRLLRALLRAPGRVFSRRQLMEAVWEEPDASLERTVDSHVKTLRAKLRDVRPELDPIVTHRGLGYSLEEPR